MAGPPTEGFPGHGSGLLFDVTQDQHVEVPHSAALSFDKMTVAVLAQLDTSQVGSAGDRWTICEKAGEYVLDVEQSTMKPRFGVYIGGVLHRVTSSAAIGGLFPSGSLFPGATLFPSSGTGDVHLLGRYNGTTLSLYMNGALVGSLAQTGVIDKGTSPLEIGESAAMDAGWNGGLDEFALWSRAVAVGEIAGIVAAVYGTVPSPPPPPPPPPPGPPPPPPAAAFEFTIPFHTTEATIRGTAGQEYTIGGIATMPAGVRDVVIEGSADACISFTDWLCPPGSRGFALVVKLTTYGVNQFTVVAEDRNGAQISQIITITLRRVGVSPPPPPPPPGPPPPPPGTAHLLATWLTPLGGTGRALPGAKTYRVTGTIQDGAGVSYIAIGDQVIFESSVGPTIVTVDHSVLIGIGWNTFVVTFSNGDGETATSTLRVEGFAPQIIGGLGCGEYAVIVKERGGVANLAVLPWASIEWSRLLSATGDATVQVGSFAADPTCVPLLGEISAWTHELSLNRDTYEMWLGPMLLPSYAQSGATFQAEDMSTWLDVRLLHRDHVYKVAADLSEIAQAYFDDAIKLENGMRLSIVSSQSGVRNTRDVRAGQHLLSRDEWDSLATAGMPWYALGRAIAVGKAVFPSVPVTLFTDRHFVGQPEVVIDGKNMGTVWGVRGNGGGMGDDPIWAAARAANAASLLIERVVDVDALDLDSAQESADAYRAAYAGSVGILKSGVLTSDAPITIDQLLPGQLVNVALADSIVPVVGQYRLSAINGKATSDGKEQISVTFAQVGVPTVG